MKTLIGPVLSLALVASSFSQGIDENSANSDPYFLSSQNATDIWISSASGLGIDDLQLRVGGSGDFNHILFRFNLPPTDQKVRRVTLNLYCLGNNGGSNVDMSLDVVTSPWDNTTNWSTQPSATFLKPLPAPAVSRLYEIDVTQLYRQWKSGAIPNYGIQLRPNGNANQFNVFHSTNALNSLPFLIITPEWVLTFPLPGAFSPNRVSSNFGDPLPNEFCGTSRRLNTGIDFPAPVGTEVRAVARGTVRVVAKDPKLGGYIVVQHVHPTRVLNTIYHYLEPIKRNDSDKSGPKYENLKVGDSVERGQVIGRIALGSETIAPRLHLQIREAGYEYPVSLATSLPEGQSCADAPQFPELFFDMRNANWVEYTGP